MRSIKREAIDNYYNSITFDSLGLDLLFG